jgi:hypothetical protein
VCVQREEKKEKKVAEKEKNLAQTDWFNSDDREKASSNYFAWFDMKKNLLFSRKCFISSNIKIKSIRDFNWSFIKIKIYF